MGSGLVVGNSAGYIARSGIVTLLTVGSEKKWNGVGVGVFHF